MRKRLILHLKLIYPTAMSNSDILPKSLVRNQGRFFLRCVTEYVYSSNT